MNSRAEYYSPDLQVAEVVDTILFWFTEKSDGSWQRMVNYHKLKQVGALAAATVQNVVSLIKKKKVKIASSSWNTAIDLVNAFFSIPIMKEDQKKFRFTWQWEEYMFIYSYAPGLWYFPSFDSLDIPKDRKLTQHTNVILLARTVEQEMASTLNVLKHVCTTQLERNLMKI